VDLLVLVKERLLRFSRPFSRDQFVFELHADLARLPTVVGLAVMCCRAVRHGESRRGPSYLVLVTALGHYEQTEARRTPTLSLPTGVPMDYPPRTECSFGAAVADEQSEAEPVANGGSRSR
jgi:hypothetical protein